MTDRIRALRHNADVRRFTAAVLAGVLLAVITGPEGREGHPTYAITQALHAGRLIVCILILVGLWLLYSGWLRYGEAVHRQTTPLVEQTRAFFAPRRVRYPWYGALLAVAILLPPQLSGYWQLI